MEQWEIDFEQLHQNAFGVAFYSHGLPLINPFITSVTIWSRFSGLAGSAPDLTTLVCFLKCYMYKIV